MTKITQFLVELFLSVTTLVCYFIGVFQMKEVILMATVITFLQIIRQTRK